MTTYGDPILRSGEAYKAALAMALKRLGGSLTVSRSDLEDINGAMIIEGYDAQTESIVLEVTTREDPRVQKFITQEKQ